MTYPTMEEVEAADREQICRWHRFSPSVVLTKCYPEIQQRIHDRFNELGGFTPGLSKKIGWEE